MTSTIRAVQADDIEAIQAFTERAFEPIFNSFAKILGPTIFAVAYPDWRKVQRDLVTTFYDNDESQMLVALVEDDPAGLLVYKLDHETKTGEIEFLVVNPAYQQMGIATQLNQLVLDKMTEGGMSVAVVGTGGDPSHAPACRAYEKIGFDKALPTVWYYKSLV